MPRMTWNIIDALALIQENASGHTQRVIRQAICEIERLTEIEVAALALCDQLTELTGDVAVPTDTDPLVRTIRGQRE